MTSVDADRFIYIQPTHKTLTIHLSEKPRLLSRKLDPLRFDLIKIEGSHVKAFIPDSPDIVSMSWNGKGLDAACTLEILRCEHRKPDKVSE
jgi:hypothetical protein